MTDITLDSNYIYGNGVIGDYLEHNTYLEGFDTLYQFNHYGPTRTGAGGAGLKDRSSGLIIRNNYIEGGAHQLQLPESQNQIETALADPDYHRTFVYGNILVAPPSSGGSSIIYFGGDQGLDPMNRKGVLYAYDNTLIARSNQADVYKIVAVELSSDGETLDARNNILAAIPDTSGGTPSDLGLLGSDNNAYFGTNWVTPDYYLTTQGVYTFTGHAAGLGNLLEGTTFNPGFVNLLGKDYHLASSSVAVDAAGRLSGMAAQFPNAQEYLHPHTSQPRPVVGAAADLGAFEHRDTTPPMISGVSTSNITDSGVTVVWTTNEASNTQVDYGTTTSYGSSSLLNSSLVTSHSVGLTGLSASTTYHYRVRSRDAAGNLALSADFTFTTAADTTVPVVGNVASDKTNGAYTVGVVIDIKVAFSETVIVSGNPFLELETGSTNRQATYLSGSGTSTLSFRYTVQVGDTSADLDYTGSGSLSLNGGTLRDTAGNNGTLTLAPPGAAGSLGANKALIIDTTPPQVSPARITLSGASGAGGIFKAGDTLTASWNNSASGDANLDIAGARFDFGPFGGTSLAASQSGGIWTASYTLGTGSLDSSGLNVALTATDDAGNSGASAASAAADNQSPQVSPARITLSGASGAGGIFKAGDTLTASWNNSAGGDANLDIAAARFDFGPFGGTSVAASQSGGIWTASYTLGSGSLDASGLNVALTATDDAGNSGASAASAAADNQSPQVSPARITLSGASGAGRIFKAGDTLTASWNNSAGGDANLDIAAARFDFGPFGGTSVAAAQSGQVWTASYLIPAGSLDASGLNVALTATDDAGNSGASAASAAADNQSRRSAQPGSP